MGSIEPQLAMDNRRVADVLTLKPSSSIRQRRIVQHHSHSASRASSEAHSATTSTTSGGSPLTLRATGRISVLVL